jgi:hypothetical protein
MGKPPRSASLPYRPVPGARGQPRNREEKAHSSGRHFDRRGKGIGFPFPDHRRLPVRCPQINRRVYRVGCAFFLLSVKPVVRASKRVPHPRDHEAELPVVQRSIGTGCSRFGDLADTWADRHSGSLQGSCGRTGPSEYERYAPGGVSSHHGRRRVLVSWSLPTTCRGPRACPDGSASHQGSARLGQAKQARPRTNAPVRQKQKSPVRVLGTPAKARPARATRATRGF